MGEQVFENLTHFFLRVVVCLVGTLGREVSFRAAQRSGRWIGRKAITEGPEGTQTVRRDVAAGNNRFF